MRCLFRIEEGPFGIFEWEAALFDDAGAWEIVAYGHTPEAAVERLGTQLSQKAPRWFGNKSSCSSDQDPQSSQADEPSPAPPQESKP